MSRPPLPTFPADYRKRFVDAGLWLDRTLHDCFAETVARIPEQVAIMAGEQRVTFGAWAAEVERVAAGLAGLGIRRGDIVTVQLPNWFELCVLQIALSRLGAIIQPMHMVYREREMEAMLRFCDARAVIVPAPYHRFDYIAAVAGMRGAPGGGQSGRGRARAPHRQRGGPRPARRHPAATPARPDRSAGLFSPA